MKIIFSQKQVEDFLNSPLFVKSNSPSKPSKYRYFFHQTDNNTSNILDTTLSDIPIIPHTNKRLI